jgi:hypothetical protein
MTLQLPLQAFKWRVDRDCVISSSIHLGYSCRYFFVLHFSLLLLYLPLTHQRGVGGTKGTCI